MTCLTRYRVQRSFVALTCKVRTTRSDSSLTMYSRQRSHSHGYTILCFGLINAPSTFQAVVTDVLKDAIGKFVLVYLDDVIIMMRIISKTAEEHVKHVRIVLELLRKHQLYAKLAKCTFMQFELKVLGQPFSGHL